MNTDLLFLNLLIQALKTKGTDILNAEGGGLGGSTGALAVSTGIRAIPSIDPQSRQNSGFCSMYLIIDKTNRTTFPFLGIGNSDAEIRQQINDNINLVQSNNGVMSMGGNSLRVIDPKDLTPTMNTIIRALNASSYEALFGSETTTPDVKLSQIIYQSYINIIQFINLYRINVMNLFTSQIHDPNTDIILSNGTIILPNGLQAVLTNVYQDQSGQMMFNIFFTLNYNLQRSGKNDLMYS